MKCPKCGFFLFETKKHGHYARHCYRCGFFDSDIPAALWGVQKAEPVDGRMDARIRYRLRNHGVTAKDVEVEVIR